MLTLFPALRQPHLDISFRVSGVDVEIVERPGQWMPPERLHALSADLRSIAAKTLDEKGLDYGVFSGDASAMKACVITLVRAQGQPIAFNALAIIPVHRGKRAEEVLHLGLVMVDPAQRSQGLSWILYGLTCMLLFLRGGLRPISISNVTQVPAVVGMVAETFSQVVPNPDDPRPRDFRKIQLARQIMAKHRHVFGVGAEAGFDEARFIIQNAYTGGSDNLKKTYEDAPKHRDERFNQWCAETLDYGRGDDVLQIGQLDFATVQRYARRSVPRAALVRFGVLGGLMVINGALLPALFWLNTQSDFGRVRAR